MSKLDEIILHLAAGAMEYQNPRSVTAYGSATAIGPQTAKQQIKDLMLELIGEDYTTTTFGYDERTLKIANQVKTTMRQRVNDL